MKFKPWSSGSGKGYNYWCQGCKDAHSIRTEGFGPLWQVTGGDTDKPTVKPSVLVTTGHHVKWYKPDLGCWCTYYAEHPEEDRDFECRKCHTLIKEGMVQFLSDCSHELANQTLPVPDWPENTHD